MYSHLLNFLAVFASCTSILGGLYLITTVYTVMRFRARTVPAAAAPPVTILKPLCGDEYGLADNLRSFCRQNYPTYQIVFGIQNPADPALSIAHKIAREFQQLDIATRQSFNLKVANLQNMMVAAKYDYLVIADSDMRVQPDYLSNLMGELADPSVGAATCLYRGVSNGSIWSDLGTLQINYNFLPQAVLGDQLNMGNGCFGATIAIRRETLTAIGGLSAIGRVLADDHEIGLRIRRLGLKVAVSAHIIDNVISEPSLSGLFVHESRWARTINIVHKEGYIGSTLTHPLALAFIGFILNPLSHMAFLILVSVAFLRLLMVLCITRLLDLPFSLLWLVPLRDMLSFAIFLNGFFNHKVKWRNSTFHIGHDGHITLGGDLTT